MQQNTKYKYLMSLGHFCSDINQGALSAVLPFLIAAHGYSYATAASLVMISNLVGSAVQPLIGYLSDKRSTTWAIPAGVLMAGSGIALTGFTSSFFGLCIAVVISGTGVSLFHPQAVKLVNYASDADNKARSIGIFSFGGSLGFSLGPMLVSTAILAVGMHGTAVFLALALVSSTIFFSQYKSMSELGAGRSRAGSGGGAAGADDWRAFGRLCFVIFGRSIMMCGMNTFLALYWIHELGQTERAGSAALSVYYAMGAICTLLGGRLADRFGCRRMIRISLSFFIPAILLLVFTHNLYLAGLLLLPIVASLYFSYSPMVVLGQQYLPNHVGFASGVTLGLAISIGGIMAPVLGMVADRFSLSAAFCAMAALAVVPLTASFFLKPAEDEAGEQRA
ncbi:MFS transporter [uncultured Cloacibacillus sp.]|uniref:MFS transporter n=1 Tax=uncultured Cloacibacillus sp. TaxID=889794 RepID=UPI003208A485